MRSLPSPTVSGVCKTLLGLLSLSATTTAQVDTVPDCTAILKAVKEKIGAPAPDGLRMRGTVEAFWVTTHQSTPFGKGKFELLRGPGKHRLLEVNLGTIGSYAWGSDGKTSWRREPVAGATYREGRDERVDTLLTDALIGRFELHNYYMSTKTKKSTVDSKPVFEIHGRRDEPEADVWYVDAKTEQPSGATLRSRDGLGTERNWTLGLGNWQPTNQRHYPKEIKFREGHLELRMTTTSIDADEPAQPKRFALNAAARKNADKRAADASKQLDAAKAPLIRVLDLPAAEALVVRAKVKPSEISLSFAKILPQVMMYVAGQGVRPAGAPFSIYHSFSPEQVDLEAGFPVSKKLEGKGDIKRIALPAGSAAVTWHIGPFHKLGDTHQRMRAWVEANGYEAAGPLREYYWTDPGLEPDERKWRTEMILPVRKAKK